MSLTPSPECAALVDSAERMVRERYDYASLRAVLASADDDSRARWHDFAELGWLAVPLAEADGGLGLAPSVASALIAALGPAAMSEPLPSQLALSGYLLGRARPTPRRDAVLARWLAGDSLLALLEPLPATGMVMTTHGDAVLDGHAGAVLDAGLADVLIVGARQEDGVPAYYLVDADAEGVARHAQRGADGRDFADVALRGVRVGASERLDLTAAAPGEAQGYFALLLASESLGIMHALVRLTAEHLAQREQFGRKLIDFQELQHRLVDMQLEAVRAESMLEVARLHCDQGGLGTAAAMTSAALYQAARSGRRVAEEAVQLHGAIGMTDELVVGHYLKRIISNAIIGGHAETHLERAASARGISSPSP